MLNTGTSGYQGLWVWDLHNGTSNGNNISPSLYGWRQYGDYGTLGSGSKALGGSTVSSTTGEALNEQFPDYFAMALAAKIIKPGGNIVKVTSSDPNLDVYAVTESNGHLELLVVNKLLGSLKLDGTGPTDPAHPYPSITGTFNFSGFNPAASAQISQYGSVQDTAQKGANTQIGLQSFVQALTLNGSSFDLAFPNYSMTVVDLAPAAPQVASGNYPWQTSGNKIQFTFNQAMDASTFQVGDLTLINQDGGAVPVIQSVSYDGTTATFLLAGTPQDGNYSATLSTVSNANGSIAPYSFNFFALAGDANHDRSVDNADFTIMFNHFAQSGTFADGDFNYDGFVDNADFTMMFNNFTKTLAAPNVNQTATVIAAPTFATTVNTTPTPTKVAPSVNRRCMRCSESIR